MRLPALVLACLFLFVSPALAQKLDETPRVAVISAFPPEIGALNAATADQKAYEVKNFNEFTEVPGDPDNDNKINLVTIGEKKKRK